MPDARLLVVEDEPLLLEILISNLEDAGYQCTAAEDGESAWQAIQAEPSAFDAIVLDRLMPDMDGIEVLKRIKSHQDLQQVPVIMQTSLTSEQDIAEGLHAGAYYYLTKPFAAESLLAIVGHAVAERKNKLELQAEAQKTSASLRLLDQATFTFKTREDARGLAALAAQVTPDPQRVVLGLSELLLNAIEHGNLAITYAEKSDLLANDAMEAEIHRRLNSAEYGQRIATLRIVRDPLQTQFTIQDQGTGFDWSNYLEMSPDRAFDRHGRGIAMAKMISFDGVQYQGNGNTVTATVKTPS